MMRRIRDEGLNRRVVYYKGHRAPCNKAQEKANRYYPKNCLFITSLREFTVRRFWTTSAPAFGGLHHLLYLPAYSSEILQIEQIDNL